MNAELQQSIDKAVQSARRMAEDNGHSLSNWVFVKKSTYTAIKAECTTCKLAMQIDVQEKSAQVSNMESDSPARLWKCPNRELSPS